MIGLNRLGSNDLINHPNIPKECLEPPIDVYIIARIEREMVRSLTISTDSC